MIITFEGKHEVFYFQCKSGVCKCGLPAKFAVMAGDMNTAYQCGSCFNKRVGWPEYSSLPRIDNDPWYDALFSDKKTVAVSQ